MTLPPFSGHFREWPRFRSVVEEILLRHPYASEVQRYAALASSLSGVLAQLIASAALLLASFSAAWALLLQRYDWPRFLGYAFIDALLDCPPATSSQPSSLQVLHAQPDLATEVSLESHFVPRLFLHPCCEAPPRRHHQLQHPPGLAAPPPRLRLAAALLLRRSMRTNYAFDRLLERSCLRLGPEAPPRRRP